MSSAAGPVSESRAETAFEDYKPALTEAMAWAEANRCLYCFDAPCTEACPTSIDVPDFIRKIATGNVKGSARTILSSNIFGMSCARVCPVEKLCAGACVLHGVDAPPIKIGRLQRYVTDRAYAEQWRFFEAGPDTGKKVVLVGGGPASLAAAHRLRRYGHAAVIYEKRDVLGGLGTWGIAPHKIRADRAIEEVEWVLSIGGIEVHTGVTVGAGGDLSWADVQEGADALFLGVGLGADTQMDLPGDDLPGVQGAVDFIEQMKMGEVDLAGVRHAAVIGGGNTALDAVRELLTLGVQEVTLVYRRTEGEMSGYEHEWSAAKVSGARALWRTLPVAFEGDGRVQRMKLVDVDGDRKVLAGTEREVPVDLVLMAIGQQRLPEVPEGLEGVALDRGKVVVDARQATGRPGVYAGGDCVSGGKEVVNAVDEGQRAADAIDEHLKKTGGHRA